MDAKDPLPILPIRERPPSELEENLALVRERCRESLCRAFDAHSLKIPKELLGPPRISIEPKLPAGTPYLGIIQMISRNAQGEVIDAVAVRNVAPPPEVLGAPSGGETYGPDRDEVERAVVAINHWAERLKRG